MLWIFLEIGTVLNAKEEDDVLLRFEVESKLESMELLVMLFMRVGHV